MKIVQVIPSVMRFLLRVCEMTSFVTDVKVHEYLPYWIRLRDPCFHLSLFLSTVEPHLNCYQEAAKPHLTHLRSDNLQSGTLISLIYFLRISVNLNRIHVLKRHERIMQPVFAGCGQRSDFRAITRKHKLGLGKYLSRKWISEPATVYAAGTATNVVFAAGTVSITTPRCSYAYARAGGGISCVAADATAVE